jgi:hypothetical protein
MAGSGLGSLASDDNLTLLATDLGTEAPPMALDGLRARLEQLLAEHTRGGDTRAYTDGLYQALVDTKVALAQIRDARQVTERELAQQRRQHDDAERRGRLAEQIGDQETVDLAQVWTAKHAERVALLERKLEVQQDELRLAERQLEELTQAYRQAKAGIPSGAGPAARTPGADEELAGLEIDRHAREATVRDQLAELKRKLGRQE